MRLRIWKGFATIWIYTLFTGIFTFLDQSHFFDQDAVRPVNIDLLQRIGVGAAQVLAMGVFRDEIDIPFFTTDLCQPFGRDKGADIVIDRPYITSVITTAARGKVLPKSVPVINSDEIAAEIRKTGLVNINTQELANGETGAGGVRSSSHSSLQ